MLTLKTWKSKIKLCFTTMERNYQSESNSDGSFCLAVLNQKKKKNHSRPTIYMVTNWVQHLFWGSSVLDHLLAHMGNRAWSKQILFIFAAFQLSISFHTIRRQPSLGCSYSTLQTQRHPGTNQAPKRKQSTPWGNSSLFPKSTQAPLSHPLKPDTASEGWETPAQKAGCFQHVLLYHHQPPGPCWKATYCAS